MERTIKVTPQEIMWLGIHHQRYVSIADAEKALESTRLNQWLDKELKNLTDRCLSQALDIARMYRTE